MIEQIKKGLKTQIENRILKLYGCVAPVIVEEPKKSSQGDISVPVFSIVKSLSKPLPEIAAVVNETISQGEFAQLLEEVTQIGGFINVKLNKKAVGKLIVEDFSATKEYGKSSIGNGKTVCIDYSSPNIAKPFSIGHLRSTIIGHAIGNILQKCGYTTVRINHLGDFGTQFGKIIYSYLNFGDQEAVKKNPIDELVKLYVEFHERAKDHPAMEDKAREIFKELEQNNPQYVALWQWFREASMNEYMKVYELLKVSFDSYNGEAFYNDKMDAVIEELKAKNLLKKDQGAMIVDLGEEYPPALVQKSDGSTLYITRDLAALFYRRNTYHFDKALYVVGNEQKLHFDQIKKVVDLMGYDFSDDIVHVNFGLVLQDGKKMSTRKGKIVKLIDVLKEAIQLSQTYIEDKNPDLENKELTAEKIGVGAVIFNDLKNYRSGDFEFNLDEMVNFTGQTGPYLQYTSVRITSILEAVEYHQESEFDPTHFEDDTAFEMLKQVSIYQEIIERSATEYAPSILAKYLLNLASLFNSYYGKEKINVENKLERDTKCRLITMLRNILNDGMNLLGMQIIEKM